MNNRMRDLEQIQERDPEESGRRLGTMVMAALTLVGLSSAVGVVVGRAAQPDADEGTDPLAAIDFGDKAGEAAAQAGQADDDTKATKVETTELTFPSTLSEQEERPEVTAALEAAAREEALLADDAPAPVRPAADLPASADDVVNSSLPAAIAAGRASRQLPRTAKTDPLVAEALPDSVGGPRAPRGEEGEYTLQIISYDSPDLAASFAERLRAKGHQAFVSKAEIEGRGTFFRVRVGPFEKRHKARAYRTKFERDEGMNTYIVRRPRESAN